jgi:putative PEP-CTERM system histidine kinase
MIEQFPEFLSSSVRVSVAGWSYGLAATAYLVFAFRIGMEWKRSARAELMMAAMVIGSLWSVAELLVALHGSPAAGLAAEFADVARYLVWMFFIGQLVAADDIVPAGRRGTLLWSLSPIAIAGLCAVGLLVLSRFLLEDSGSGLASFSLRLMLAVFGLLLVEQVYTRAHRDARWAIKPLCVALAGIFVFDLVLYADAVLRHGLDPDIWIARGIANLLVLPFIALATARNPEWKVRLRVSRVAVIRSGSLLGCALFALAVAAAGELIRHSGGEWGRPLQIGLFFLALIAFAVAASSGRLRAKLKVMVSKHFFSYRYDYRTEWLRFTHALATETSVQSVQQRVLIALADLVESRAGVLWLREGEDFHPRATWHAPSVDAKELPNSPLVQFLARTGWVVALDEYAQAPERYPDLRLPPWLTELPGAWLIVPLFAGAELSGFVVLGKPLAGLDVNWEVRDLLKTAGRQAASYLGHVQATEALLEARKFDSFHRMSAFVVHDLKNLVTQLSLMLRNAERHRHNPEFQADMLMTVEHAVERLNHLMLELRTGTTPLEEPRPVEIASVVRQACTLRARGREVELDLEPGVIALAHEDRLERIVGHLVQNALDATTGGGSVKVRLSSDERDAHLEIADNGVGMSPEFIRQRLFKPFETTKTAGMGIGVYESSQYVQALRGRMCIDSKINEGTRVRVELPLRQITPEPVLAKKEEVA